jgi:probable F420-dependent oxidoreductase
MSVRIGVGPGLGLNLSPQDYWRWVDFCEDAGIDSIWHSDQLLGATLEPLALLAALAARTRRMRFGTNALVLPFREPLVVAKQLATIDFLSGGRVFPVLGVGNGFDPYWAATGAEPRQRGRRSNEAIALIKRLLSEDEVDFAGAHFRYRGPGVGPRPARAIPLWTGGHSAAAIRRTAELGDGWLGGLLDAGTAAETRRRIEAALAETGRSIEPDHYGVTLPLRIGEAEDPAVLAARRRLEGYLPDGGDGAAADAFAIGRPEDIVALMQRHVASGMSKFVVLPIASDAADLMAQTELLAGHVRPAIEDGV